MARKFTNPFIGQRAYGRGAAANTIDLSQSGSVQFAPNLAKLAANTPYVRRNVIPFLIEAPKFFQYVNDSALMIQCLKAFIENHTRTVEGLNQQITVESGEAPVGGSGEMIQAPTNVVRARSNPVHGCWELQGRALAKFIKWWITYGIGDENTKVPLVVSNGSVQAAQFDATFYGATVLYIEPDPTFTDVVSAWLCTNMYPTATPPWDGSKDAALMGQGPVDVSIEFTALTDVSVGTELFAREILQSLNVAGLNPNENPLWLEKISADVEKAKNGLKGQLETGAANRISF